MDESEREFEFVSEYTDEDEYMPVSDERRPSEGRGPPKKGIISSQDDGKRKSSFDRKPPLPVVKKTKRKMKTVTKLSMLGIKNRTKVGRDKKAVRKGSVDSWERVNTKGDESSSVENVGVAAAGAGAIAFAHEGVAVENDGVDSDANATNKEALSRKRWPTIRQAAKMRSFRAASHAVEWVANPRRRSGELRPLKPARKKTRVKHTPGGAIGGGGAGGGRKKKEKGRWRQNEQAESPWQQKCLGCWMKRRWKADERDLENDDDDGAEKPVEVFEELTDDHVVSSCYSDDFTEDDVSVTSSLNISRDDYRMNANGANNDDDVYRPVRTSAKTRYYLQQRRLRVRQGADGADGVGARGQQQDGRSAEGLYSAELRRQRVLGMYPTSYAVRWAVIPKGRVGLMTPDREALSALRRNLPPTPEEGTAPSRGPDGRRRRDPDRAGAQPVSEEEAGKCGQTTQGTTKSNVQSNLITDKLISSFLDFVSLFVWPYIN